MRSLVSKLTSLGLVALGISQAALTQARADHHDAPPHSVLAECVNCKPRHGPSAGAAAYYLRPYYEDNAALTITTGIGGPVVGRTDTSFDWDFNPAYKLWVGYTSASGLGVRGSFFHFDEDVNGPSASVGFPQAAVAPLGLGTTITLPGTLPAIPGFAGFGSPGLLLLDPLVGPVAVDNITTSSSLEFRVFDLEATYDFRVGKLALEISGGGRYLEVNQGYRADSRGSATVGGVTATETQSLFFERGFTGAGPTIALDARAPIGNGRLAVFGNVRGAFLVGETERNLAFRQTVADPGAISATGNLTVAAFNRSTRDDTLPVLEAELGAEYSIPVGDRRLFLQGAAVNHTYFGVGSATSENGNLSLFGLRVAVGIDF